MISTSNLSLSLSLPLHFLVHYDCDWVLESCLWSDFPNNEKIIYEMSDGHESWTIKIYWPTQLRVKRPNNTPVLWCFVLSSLYSVLYIIREANICWCNCFLIDRDLCNVWGIKHSSHILFCNMVFIIINLMVYTQGHGEPLKWVFCLTFALNYILKQLFKTNNNYTL